MKNIGYLLYAVLAIGGTVFFILRKSRNEKTHFNEKYKNYKETHGNIIKKQQRIGSKAKVLITYTVSYVAEDGKEYKQTSNNVGNGLANSYETGDTLTVFYNPSNPYDPITDRTGIEMGSEMFNYNNIIPYAVGVLILLGALLFYSKKT